VDKSILEVVECCLGFAKTGNIILALQLEWLRDNALLSSLMLDALCKPQPAEYFHKQT
jgi:hypothetical protein